MKIDIKTRGFIGTQKKLKQSLHPVYKKTIFVLATKLESEAKQNIRNNKSIISGKLQQSIINSPLGNINRKVKVGVDYAKYVEFGRGAITAKGDKLLWIPISLRAKKSGYRKGMKFGKDFVLAKKVKKAKAKPFFEPAVKVVKKESGKELKRQLKKFYNG